MSKYSFAFKLKIVKEYLEGPLGFRLLAKKHKIPDKKPIREWVNSYKAFGEEGLRKKHSKTVYSKMGKNFEE